MKITPENIEKVTNRIVLTRYIRVRNVLVQTSM